jgi:addiction module HigA family antidote
MAKLAPLHPGEVLREEFLVPMGLSAYALAEHCHVPRTRIERIAAEETGISADTALRLSAALGTTAEFWLNLQSRYEVEKAKEEIGDELETISIRAA